ncbi:MAG: YpdA family putative bacillithiol disulfide reductase [Flavobacteriaceae bacterium]|nr:YpdA family putative bacillithiol disulfide reductase [Flavobacteriaceae bacterium]
MKDLIIIGAGPIGLACGISAKEKNLNYSIIEKGTLVNSLFNYPLNMTFFSTSDRLEIGNIPFISQQPKPTRAEALEYYRRVASSKELKINLYEEITTINKSKKGFNLSTTKNNYSTKALIIATGFYDLPYLINVPGENLSKVKHYYSEPHPYFGMNLAIIGSANSAVDAALETYRKGAKSVTMIIREKEIGENVKYWAKPDILNRIKEESIKAYFESNVQKITDEFIFIKTPKKELSIKNDFVLAMTGYQPNFKLLESLGVSFKSDIYKTPLYNDKTMESNVSRVYLAGVVCGGLKTNKWFIENSREHAQKIIQDICQG